MKVGIDLTLMVCWQAPPDVSALEASSPELRSESAEPCRETSSAEPRIRRLIAFLRAPHIFLLLLLASSASFDRRCAVMVVFMGNESHHVSLAAHLLPPSSQAIDGDRQMLLRDWLDAEPFTLALSASFLGLYAHAGALRALAEAGLEPARVTGCSSGSIVGAPVLATLADTTSHTCVAWQAFLYAAGLCPLRALPELLLSLRAPDILVPFWRRSPICWLRGGLFRIRTDVLSAACAPVTRLEDVVRCPISISTHDARADMTAVHSAGVAAPIIAASCAVPFIMQPVNLPSTPSADARASGSEPMRPHVDGCLRDPLALASVAQAERVLVIDLHVGGRLDKDRPAHMAEEQMRRWGAGRHLDESIFVRITDLPAVFPTNMRRYVPCEIRRRF